MKLNEFISLEKRLAQVFPDFDVKNQTMILRPLEYTLRGFHFDGSAFDRKSFYVTSFFMPLYVPAEEFHFTFGHRVRDVGGDRWNVEIPSIESTLAKAMRSEVDFLRKLCTLQDVANALEALIKPNNAGYVNPHCYEALAYTLVKTRDITRALSIMEMLIKGVNPAVAWEVEIASRVKLIKDKLKEGVEMADSQLEAWTSATLGKLDLARFYEEARD